MLEKLVYLYTFPRNERGREKERKKEKRKKRKKRKKYMGI